MLQSLAKIAVHLDIDKLANRFMERFYTNTRGASERFSRRFQILCYHKVSHETHPFFEPTSPAVFEEHLRFLKNCYRVMNLDELVERSQRGEVPDRAVAITFDDGYRDNYQYAFPLLKKHGLPATIFVATGAIETGRSLWHDRIFDAFRYATVTRAHLESAELPELSLETAAERERSLNLALDRARQLYGESQLLFVDRIEGALLPKGQPHESVMLTWKEIREMHEAGIQFGSHTVNHPILSRVPREELLTELLVSRNQLSEATGSPIRSFAYPNGRPGDYNAEVKEALKECGYTCAVTTTLGPNRAYADPFELKRGQPWQRDIDLFRFNFFLQRHELANVRN